MHPCVASTRRTLIVLGIRRNAVNVRRNGCFAVADRVHNKSTTIANQFSRRKDFRTCLSMVLDLGTVGSLPRTCAKECKRNLGILLTLWHHPCPQEQVRIYRHYRLARFQQTLASVPTILLSLLLPIVRAHLKVAGKGEALRGGSGL